MREFLRKLGLLPRPIIMRLPYVQWTVEDSDLPLYDEDGKRIDDAREARVVLLTGKRLYFLAPVHNDTHLLMAVLNPKITDTGIDSIRDRLLRLAKRMPRGEFARHSVRRGINGHAFFLVAGFGKDEFGRPWVEGPVEFRDDWDPRHPPEGADNLARIQALHPLG